MRDSLTGYGLLQTPMCWSRIGAVSYEAWRYAAEEGADWSELADRAAAQAPTRENWECQRGCSHCCHLLVEVTAAETEALSRVVTPAIHARIETNAKRAAGLGPSEYRALRQPCAFLGEEGECLAYDVRPLRCRAHVSSSEQVCHRVLEGDPATPSGSVPGDVWLATVIAAIQTGLGNGSASATEELHTAIARLGESRRG
jgi:Fe-S-cluster containining protein